ncbi:unnamed protein product [Ectocarpus sp. 12 AP-2014]
MVGIFFKYCSWFVLLFVNRGDSLRLALLCVGNRGRERIASRREPKFACRRPSENYETRRDKASFPTNNHDLQVVKSFVHGAVGRPAGSTPVWRLPWRRLSLSSSLSCCAHTLVSAGAKATTLK